MKFLKTAEEEVKFYTKLLDVVIAEMKNEHFVKTGFCWYIESLLERYYEIDPALVIISNIDMYFPELWAFKPVQQYSVFYWFLPTEEGWIQYRIPILNQIIKSANDEISIKT
jgi:hypothetical protein